MLKQETKVGAEGFDVRLDCQYNIQTVLVCLRDAGRDLNRLSEPLGPWLVAPEVLTSDMLWRSRNHILGASNAEGCKVHRSYTIQHHRRGVSTCNFKPPTPLFMNKPLEIFSLEFEFEYVSAHLPNLACTRPVCYLSKNLIPLFTGV